MTDGPVTADMALRELHRMARLRAGELVHMADVDLDHPTQNHCCGLCLRPQGLREGAAAPVPRLCRDCAGAQMYFPGIDTVVAQATIEQMNELLGLLLTQEGEGIAYLHVAMLGRLVDATIGGANFRIWPEGRVRMLVAIEEYQVSQFWGGYLQEA